MKWVADITQRSTMHCFIERFASRDMISGDAVEGYYLYVWENGQGIDDDLQDDLETATDVAFKRFQVPQSAWRQAA